MNNKLWMFCRILFECLQNSLNKFEAFQVPFGMVFNEASKETFQFLMVPGGGADSIELFPFGFPKHL